MAPHAESRSKTITVRIDRGIVQLLDERAGAGARSAVVEMAIRFYFACEDSEDTQRKPLNAFSNGFVQGFDTSYRAAICNELTPDNVDQVLTKYLKGATRLMVRFPERITKVTIPERMRAVAASIETEVRAARQRQRRTGFGDDVKEGAAVPHPAKHGK